MKSAEKIELLTIICKILLSDKQSVGNKMPEISFNKLRYYLNLWEMQQVLKQYPNCTDCDGMGWYLGSQQGAPIFFCEECGGLGKILSDDHIQNLVDKLNQSNKKKLKIKE